MTLVMSVTEFIGQINTIIAGEFTVEGEIQQFKISQGKWIFFDLKDATSCLNCFSTIFMIKTPLEDGMKVRVTGYPKIREANGRFSFTVQLVELVGEGALKKVYLMLKEKLLKEGLFAPERKRQLPYLPHTIGVIASRDSAAFGDFKRILSNRWGGLNIVLRHCLVQGDGAVADIVNAFSEFNSDLQDCELVVLIRGGGSLEDLQAFNSEEVARAVYGSRLPVVCGVGHERDESLADFVADVRASTPSNAAEIIIPDKRDFASQLESELENIIQTLEHQITHHHRSLEQNFYLIASKMEAPLQSCHNLLDQFSHFPAILENIWRSKFDFVNQCEILFKNVDPKQVLKRGYSIARNHLGKIIKNAAEVAMGEKIMVELSHGSLQTQVTKGGKPILSSQKALF